MNSPIRKAGAPGQAAPDDASIPVLTERLTLPPLELDTSLPMEVPPQIDTSLPREAQEWQTSFTQPPAPIAAPTPVAPAAPLAGGDGSGGGHWTRIEVELRSSILQAVADSLPQEVDAIVRSRMNEAVDRLVAQLAAETRLALAASLRDIVDHAVRAELNRLRALKR